MAFDLAEAMRLLERTPSILHAWLVDLPESWVRCTEGPKTWSPFDIVGHLIHGEKTDWIPRARIILRHGASREFEPFDRFAHLEANAGRPLGDLLAEFQDLRRQGLEELRTMELTEAALGRKGLHPELGEVTLRQLLSTWTAHDLNHLHQIARVMARRYSDSVGPWKAYLGILNPSRDS